MVHFTMGFGYIKYVLGVGECISFEFKSIVKPKAYLESSRTFKIELFCKNMNIGQKWVNF